MTSKIMYTMSHLGLAAVTTAVGCATPCVDDGLKQSFCPVAGSAGTADDGTASGADASVTVGDTDPGPGPDSSGEASSATAGSAGSQPDICPVLDVALTPEVPMVVILLDQSASMNEMFGDVSRWDAVGDTLFDPTDGVIVGLQSKIRFGLTLYTRDTDANVQCPFLQEAAVAIDNFDAMRNLYESQEPIGDTPTGESLSAVTDVLAQSADPARKFIILATDGEPDTCAQPNPNEGQSVAVEAAENAFTAGFKTFVISVGNDVSDAHLQDMANAGAGVSPGDPDAEFFKALDQQALLDAFDDIVAEVQDCRLTLSEPLKDDMLDSCAVALGGEIVPQDPTNGWQLIAEDKIELVGEPCERVQQAEALDVQMLCDCEAVGRSN